MGFTPEPTHYKLVFTQPEYLGLEVTVRAMSVRESLDFDDLRFAEVATAKDLRAKQEAIGRQLADVIVEWNVEIPAGSPLEPAYESLLLLENPMAEALTTAWLTTTSGVRADVPLDQGAPAGLADAPMTVSE